MRHPPQIADLTIFYHNPCIYEKGRVLSTLKGEPTRLSTKEDSYISKEQ